MTSPTGLVPLLLITLALAFAGVATFLEGRRRAAAAIAAGGAPAERDNRWSAVRAWLDTALLKSSWGRTLTYKVHQAGLDRRPADVLAVIVVVPLASAAVVGWLIGWLPAAITAVMVSRLSVGQLDRLINKRRERFIAQLPQVARLMSNGVQAGLSLRRTLALTAAEIGPPASVELSAVGNAVEVGVSLQTALNQLESRVPSREVSVLVKTLIIQARSGGKVVYALQRIATTLEDRKKLRSELLTVLSAPIYTSFAMPALGVLGILIVTGGDRETIALLFSETIGQIAVAIAGLLLSVAVYLVRRYVRRAVQ